MLLFFKASFLKALLLLLLLLLLLFIPWKKPRVCKKLE